MNRRRRHAVPPRDLLLLALSTGLIAGSLDGVKGVCLVVVAVTLSAAFGGWTSDHDRTSAFLRFGEAGARWVFVGVLVGLLFAEATR